MISEINGKNILIWRLIYILNSIDNNHYNDDEPIVNPSGFFNELS